MIYYIIICYVFALMKIFYLTSMHNPHVLNYDVNLSIFYMNSTFSITSNIRIKDVKIGLDIILF